MDRQIARLGAFEDLVDEAGKTQVMFGYSAEYAMRQPALVNHCPQAIVGRRCDNAALPIRSASAANIKSGRTKTAPAPSFPISSIATSTSARLANMVDHDGQAQGRRSSQSVVLEWKIVDNGICQDANSREAWHRLTEQLQSLRGEFGLRSRSAP